MRIRGNKSASGAMWKPNLHGNTVASSTGGCIRVFALADGSPHGWHQIVARALAVVDQTGGVDMEENRRHTVSGSYSLMMHRVPKAVQKDDIAS